MIRLRPYQEKAIEGTLEAWNDSPSALMVLPTGTGKTVTFAEIIRRRLPERALIVAHRDHLVYQAAEKLRTIGVDSQIEMNTFHASTTFWGRAPVVIATVQTLNSGGEDPRMEKFDPKDFGLLVIDECHHATATTYRRMIDHFKQNPELKVLGVTATPDRADEEALGQIFGVVGYDYEILDAIHEGWLVPIEQQMVTIEGLDFSMIRTTAGDLNGGELAEVMEQEKNLHGVVSATLDIVGDRRTLLFAVSVHQAETYCEIFNRYKPEMADWVSGETPKDERWKKIQKFKSGKTQIMTNVGVFTEGFDDPGIEVVVMARPTKSRCLYSQCVGRGTRPPEVNGRSIVDEFHTAEARVLAIQSSAKKSLLVIDFVGNSGRHKLVSSADLLGGNVTEEVIERAEARARQEGRPIRMDEALEEEERKLHQEIEERKRREAARRMKLVGKAQYHSMSVDPFDLLDIHRGRERGWEKGKSFSEKQANLLRRQGINPDNLTYHEGTQIIAELFRRWSNKLAMPRQIAILKKRNVEFDPKTLNKEDASRLISDIAAREGWRKKEAVAQ